MRILTVIYCYPPLLFPATMRCLKIVKGLRDCGAEVEVVTVDPETFVFPEEGLTDPDLVQLIPPGVVNHSIRSWESNPLVKALKAVGPLRSLLYRAFEPRKKEWIYPALRHLRRSGLERFDLILTCSQPHCNHLLGSRLKRMTAKPWVAFFSDPWTDNVYASFESEKVRRYHLTMEGEVMREADLVFFNSSETADLVLRKYPAATASKCGVLPHSFVPQWYRMGEGGAPRTGKIRLVQTGHFYGPRTPMPLLKALADLSRSLRLEEMLEFHFYGSMDDTYQRFMTEHRLDRVVHLMGTVPYLKSLAVMNEADFLLLIDAPLTETAQSVFLPSKLVDYLGSGKPVLGITPAAGTSARVLRETGNFVCDIHDERAIRSMLERVASGTLRPAPRPEAVRHYENREVCGRFYAELQSLHDGSRALSEPGEIRKVQSL